VDVIWRKPVSTNAISEIHVGGFSEYGEFSQQLANTAPYWLHVAKEVLSHTGTVWLNTS